MRRITQSKSYLREIMVDVFLLSEYFAYLIGHSIYIITQAATGMGLNKQHLRSLKKMFNIVETIITSHAFLKFLKFIISTAMKSTKTPTDRY